MKYQYYISLRKKFEKLHVYSYNKNKLQFVRPTINFKLGSVELIYVQLYQNFVKANHTK